jgi:5-methylcytosine-specific restriction endonuclease McrA
MAEDRVGPSLRREVADRARGCCEYCRSQERFAMQAFSVEHIDPRSRAGATAAANLAYACQGCNNHKYNRTHGTDPVTDEAVPLFHPRRQRWRDHFAWTPDGALIVGVSPIGRATVAVLRLNREGLVNLRRLLFAAGEHPPPEGDDPPA